MAKARRYFQYRVTKVGGSMQDRIKVGDMTLDYWQGKSHTYDIFNGDRAEVTGFYSVKSEGECTPEQYDQLREQSKAIPAEVGIAEALNQKASRVS